MNTRYCTFSVFLSFTPHIRLIELLFFYQFCQLSNQYFPDKFRFTTDNDKALDSLHCFLLLLQLFTIIKQPKSAPKDNRQPIFVALERGLNASQKANIQPAVIESQIQAICCLSERLLWHLLKYLPKHPIVIQTKIIPEDFENLLGLSIMAYIFYFYLENSQDFAVTLLIL